MEKLGGGGHINIAGAQLRRHALMKSEDMLKEIIDEMYRRKETIEMKVILLEDVKALGKKGRDRKCQ